MEKQGLGPDARAFCEALLKDGEVLAVALNYLPETVLWLVTTPLQARLMRETQPERPSSRLVKRRTWRTLWAMRLPKSLWQVAVRLSAPAPDDAPENPPEESEDADDPWD